MSGGLLLNSLLAVVLALAVSGCARTQPAPPTGSAASGGYYKVGKPYQIKGIWYSPAEDYSYDETGIGSWYGPGFHQERTANGERFDQEDMTAAHKTLPMPCLVRVTNLESGRSIVVRINDRGPFKPGRIIDMSRRGAELLGFQGKGIAKVRVQILAEESRAIAAAARAGQPTGGIQVAAGAAAPSAAPRRPVEVQAVSPPVETANLPGATQEGRFLPAPVVQQQPVTGGRQIFIQAGAFTVRDNADRLRTRLTGIGQTRIVAVRLGQAQFYRVRIGPIDSVERADIVLARVTESGLNGAHIIVD